MSIQMEPNASQQALDLIVRSETTLVNSLIVSVKIRDKSVA